MRNLEDIFVATCTNQKACYQYLLREHKLCVFMGEAEMAGVFADALKYICVSRSGNYFNDIVNMLTQLNTIAGVFEEQVTNNDDVKYWYRHSFELRSSVEKIASEVIKHTSGTCPQFEYTVAETRVSCAYLLYYLENDSEAMRYAISALNLSTPAWESVAEMARDIIEATKRK